jgi:hypothetical protein
MINENLFLMKKKVMLTSHLIVKVEPKHSQSIFYYKFKYKYFSKFLKCSYKVPNPKNIDSKVFEYVHNQMAFYFMIALDHQKI